MVSMAKWMGALLLVAWVAAVAYVFLRLEGGEVGAQSPSGGDAADVFTPAHPTTIDAIRDFFGLRSEPVQPIAFPHHVHIENKLGCTDYCHTSASVGPQAGLPSVNTCMRCHGIIATDKPEVQKLAAYQDRGEDIAWQRVFDYSPSAHVRFEHAPHIRAGVECATCHGDIASQTVATRSVELTMGVCVSCHREKGAPVDCLTCHF